MEYIYWTYGNCLDICFDVYFAVWYDISDQNQYSSRSTASGVINVIKQLIVLDIDVITWLEGGFLEAVTAGHSCIINRSNSLIFAFNPWQFHWIIFWSMVNQFEFFCLWSLFFVVGLLILDFWSAMSITSRSSNLFQAKFDFIYGRSVCLTGDFLPGSFCWIWVRTIFLGCSQCSR